MSVTGTLEILENTELNGENVILARSQVAELGGLLGFMVRFLRVYRGSNTFDSYINLNTRMTARYDMYKLEDDGSKKITEQLHFDRKWNRVVSLGNNETVISDTPPDIQDAFSIFLSLLSKINTEDLFVGRKYEVNLYAYEKVARIKMEVTHFSLVDGRAIYTLEIKELPEVFKYPASVILEIADVGDGFMSVTEGECTIHIPAMPDITINIEVEVLNLAS